MKISRKWLSQYMDIRDLTIEQLQEKITAAGFEVEAVEKQSQGTNLVIGYVKECKDHPDFLSLLGTEFLYGNAERSLSAPCSAEIQAIRY